MVLSELMLQNIEDLVLKNAEVCWKIFSELMLQISKIISEFMLQIVKDHI